MKDNMNKANANMNTNNMNLNYPPQNSNIFKDPQKRKKLIIWSIVGLISLVGLYLGGSYAKNYFFPNPKEKAIRDLINFMEETSELKTSDVDQNKLMELNTEYRELYQEAIEEDWKHTALRKEIKKRKPNLQQKYDKAIKKFRNPSASDNDDDDNSHGSKTYGFKGGKS